MKQLAYVASHDLQSPLRSISGFVKLLKLEYKGKLDEEGQDWIRRTVLAVGQMPTLIRDLLSFSRVEAHSHIQTRIPFLVIVNEALALLESSIRDSQGKVTWDPLPDFMGHPSQLVQLMQNLIGNGLVYGSSEPPHIHVSCLERNNGAVDDWCFGVAGKALQRQAVQQGRFHLGSGLLLHMRKHVREGVQGERGARMSKLLRHYFRRDSNC
jgi:light-regulated signal transduction histidine kinase (bacteriophytochrome)